MQWRITIVEKNDFDVMLLEEVLGQAGAGCHLHAIYDGEQARRYFREKMAEPFRPHLILINPHLLDLDLSEALRQIRSNESFKTVPVAVWTSMRSTEIAAMEQAGLTACWMKPANLEEWRKLALIICKLLDAGDSGA